MSSAEIKTELNRLLEKTDNVEILEKVVDYLRNLTSEESVPQWQIDLNRKRKEKIIRGESKLISFDDFKKQL